MMNDLTDYINMMRSNQNTKGPKRRGNFTNFSHLENLSSLQKSVIYLQEQQFVRLEEWRR